MKQPRSRPVVVILPQSHDDRQKPALMLVRPWAYSSRPGPLMQCSCHRNWSPVGHQAQEPCSAGQTKCVALYRGGVPRVGTLQRGSASKRCASGLMAKATVLTRNGGPYRPWSGAPVPNSNYSLTRPHCPLAKAEVFRYGAIRRMAHPRLAATRRHEERITKLLILVERAPAVEAVGASVPPVRDRAMQSSNCHWLGLAKGSKQVMSMTCRVGSAPRTLVMSLLSSTPPVVRRRSGPNLGACVSGRRLAL